MLRLTALGCLALSVPAPAAKHDAFAELLARHDAMKPGPARDALALEIDKHAGQRYATVSRMYWHRDLDAAKEAARAQKRPILHLRMLGRLDEDLSCANSRFFRTTLYANAETSKFLRENFVLYWSSERPVPRVTIDFGDGRKIERTTTGNSAHYVMDERGNVLDVLPGLYAPLVFRSELAKSLALASKVRGKDDGALLDAVMAFHKAELQAATKRFHDVANVEYIVRRGRLLRPNEIGRGALEAAQEGTMTKMAIEVPDLRKIGIDAGAIDAADIAQWATVGQKVWSIEPATVLDAQSRALVEKLRAANPQPRADAIPRLEQHIVADTALNEFRLRQLIRSSLATRRTLDFASVNEWVYTAVFRTPRSDTWLGLLDGTDFTGLPGDGVVMP